MVNRGGRSRGCITCRRRRVKCDEAQPHCQRCQMASLSCSGYVQHGHFVDETARFRVTKAASRPSSASSASSPAASPADRPPTTRFPPRIPVSLLPDQDTVIHMHLVARLLPNVSGPSAPDILSSMVGYASPLAQPVHKDALRALAAVYFGKVQRDGRVFAAGVQAYVRSLQRLRAALADPVAVVGVETLVGVLCLGLYETIALSDTMGWLHHYEGISHLIERRGPKRHRSGFEHQLFRHCRFAIIISALVRRRPCYLAQPEWKAIERPPQAVDPNAFLPEEDLTSLFAQVPGLLHDFGLQTRDTPHQSTLDLQQRVQNTLSSLQAWKHRQDNANDDLPLLALHSSILLCLAPVCEAFGLPLAETHQSPVGTRSALAANICRLAKTSFDRTPSSSTGAFLFIFPLHVAARNVVPGSDEAAWIAAIMQTVLADMHGFEIGRPRTWALPSVTGYIEAT